MVDLDRLGRLVVEVLPEDAGPEGAATEARLLERAAEQRRRAGPRSRRAAGAFLVAAALLALAVAIWPKGRLEYAVHGASTTETGYVVALGGSASLAFSDGSRVELAEGASARVAEITSHGARVLVEGGRVGVHVSPRPGARWSVEAGPFAVRVTGTVFAVAWSSHAQILEVTMTEGSVIVAGPGAEGGIPLRTGQRLTADVRAGELRVGPASPEGISAPPAGTVSGEPAVVDGGAPGAAEDPDRTSIVEPKDSAAPELPSVSADARAEPPPTWASRVAAGDFAGVLADAEQRGLSEVMASAPLAELSALSDAARYGGRGELARRALTAIRTRFAGSTPAKTAAFLLGRMADDAGSSATAIRWYGDYLAEAPGGSFAAEALGRQMVAVRRTRGAEAARPFAEQYVRRFPKGPHASIARQLLGF